MLDRSSIPRFSSKVLSDINFFFRFSVYPGNIVALLDHSMFLCELGLGRGSHPFGVIHALVRRSGIRAIVSRVGAVSMFQRSSRIPTSNGSSGWNFWSMVKSPSALLATYVREKDQRHTAGAHDKGIEMVKIWVGLSRLKYS